MDLLLQRIEDWEPRAREAQHHAAQLARLCKCSLRKLERFFQERFRLCPRQWLIGTRIRHAVELLQQGRPIKDVALEVGFKFPSGLCRFFRKTTGLPPIRYVQSLVRKQTSPIVARDAPSSSSLSSSVEERAGVMSRFPSRLARCQ